MITCKECIERMRPDDPRVKSGKYHRCGCDYCDKPTYYREIENSMPYLSEMAKDVISYRHSPHIHTYTRKQYPNILLRVEQLEIALNKRPDKKKAEEYTIK